MDFPLTRSRSLAASRNRCFQPRQLSVACAEMYPKRNRICPAVLTYQEVVATQFRKLSLSEQFHLGRSHWMKSRYVGQVRWKNNFGSDCSPMAIVCINGNTEARSESRLLFGGTGGGLESPK
jgi:hypothetical protein